MSELARSLPVSSDTTNTDPKRDRKGTMSVGSSHGKRWVTAAVALPVLGLVLIKGGPIGFAVFVSLFSVLAFIEYCDLLVPEETMVAKGLGVLCCLGIMAGFYFGNEKGAMAVLMGAFLAISLFYLFRDSPSHWTVDRLSKQILGLVYIPGFFGHIVLLRHGPDGLFWTVMLLAIVFAADTGAYYVGKNMGRHKLCPRISPGKTVEGAIGGLVAAGLVASGVKWAGSPQLPWLSCILLAVVTGAATQVGDLAESVLKRSVNIKDSGKLLPGHGGILDRIDGLLFAGPVLYYIEIYVL